MTDYGIVPKCFINWTMWPIFGRSFGKIYISPSSDTLRSSRTVHPPLLLATLTFQSVLEPAVHQLWPCTKVRLWCHGWNQRPHQSFSPIHPPKHFSWPSVPGTSHPSNGIYRVTILKWACFSKLLHTVYRWWLLSISWPSDRFWS